MLRYNAFLMSDEENILPSVLYFIRSFKRKKRYQPWEDEHFPFEQELHCFTCLRKTTYYKVGVLVNSRKPEKDYKKWVVTYECDLCKRFRDYKYIPQDQEFKLLPARG